MNSGKAIFRQLLEYLPRYEFNKCVAKYNGNYKVRKFSCYDQLLCLMFAQLSGRRSLRDIETCLNSHHEKLHHIGFRGKVSRSTLADANEERDFRIYQDFGLVLIDIAQKLYKDEDLGLELTRSVYALDSTTIDLCLSLFPWATFRETKAAVKAHILLDLRGSIPLFMDITTGSVHDVKILDTLPIPTGSILVMDRGYVDYQRLYALHKKQVSFVIRDKRNLKIYRQYSRVVDKATGLRCDQTVVPATAKSSKDYPEPLRRISYVDQETGKKYVYLSDLFDLPAITIAKIYKLRWQIELFFKWIKQHLRIKVFFGNSVNAVKTQIWICVCAYLLVAIAKKRLRLECSHYTFLQIIEVTLFDKKPILQAVRDAHKQEVRDHAYNQLKLFSF